MVNTKTRQLYAQESVPVNTVHEVQWAPGPVWTRPENLAADWVSNRKPSQPQPVYSECDISCILAEVPVNLIAQSHFLFLLRTQHIFITARHCNRFPRTPCKHSRIINHGLHLSKSANKQKCYFLYKIGACAHDKVRIVDVNTVLCQ